MAILHDRKSNRRIALGSPFLVGRSRLCTLRLDDRRVSGEHARLAWTAKGWEVRDLGSRNGTFVGGRRLEPGVSVLLSAGSLLAFGDEGEGWILLDASAPEAMARDERGGVVVSAQDGFLALPDEMDLQLSIYEEAPGAWVVETAEEARRVEDQELISEGENLWRVLLPHTHEATLEGNELPGRTIKDIGLRFGVSGDEEHVDVQITSDEGETPLPESAHYYLLLTLARARLRDVNEGDIAAGDRGWMYAEDLSEMLRMDSNTLNVAVHRLRHRVAKAGIMGAAGIIERRRNTRQLRIGTERLEVRGL